MSEHITLECLKLANKLVSTCGLTQSSELHHINELDRNFFKDLFATVFGQILPGDEESTAVFYRALLACLSDIVNISLDHIDPIDVAKKDPVALYHLMELCVTYAQHLVDVDSSKDAAPSFIEVSAFKFDAGRKRDAASRRAEQTRSSGSNSTDTEALLKLGDENKYLKHRAGSKLSVDSAVKEQQVNIVEREPRVPRSKAKSRHESSDGSTWESILKPYLQQRKVQDSGAKKVARVGTMEKTEAQREVASKTVEDTKQKGQKHQVDAGRRTRSQSSHHQQRDTKRSGETLLEMEEFLRDEYPALDQPPDTVNLVEKKQQWQNQYIASNLGFYHTQRKLIQSQLIDLEKQHKGILKSKKSELEHWNRREDERDAANVRIKTRAALRDERMAKARHNRMLKEEEQQQRKMLLRNNSEDLIYRRTVDHILKCQRERLLDEKKERLGEFQKKMAKNLDELDQINRDYQERIARITSEITGKQKRDDSKAKARQQNWKERRKRLIKNVESNRKQLVRGARETHFRKRDEERLKKAVNKAAFNFEVHDTDV